MSESDFERSALVIGGASGIGWAVANGLTAEGCRVTIADLNADGAAARAADLGPPHAGAGVNVTDEDMVAALFEEDRTARRRRQHGRDRWRRPYHRTSR